MIETDKRKAVFLLHQEGQSRRHIARLLGLSRNSVRTIIEQGGAPPPPIRAPTKNPWTRRCCADFTRSVRAGWRACTKSWSKKRASR